MLNRAGRRGVLHQTWTLVAWGWCVGGALTFALTLPRLVHAVQLAYGAAVGQYAGGPLVPAGIAAHPLTAFAALDTAGIARSVDLTRQTALVLIYDRDCGVCHRNMARWMELILAARTAQVPVYALSRTDVHSASPYWAGLASQVQIFSTVDSTALTRLFGATGTPCSVLVRGGRVVAVFTGILDPTRLGWLTSHLSPLSVS